MVEEEGGGLFGREWRVERRRVWLRGKRPTRVPSRVPFHQPEGRFWTTPIKSPPLNDSSPGLRAS